MSISIKTVFDGNIHRFYLAKPSYDELEQALNSIYGKRGFSIRYQDEDGDMISVSSSVELQEAIRVANGGTLKLILSHQSGADSSSFTFVPKIGETPPVSPALIPTPPVLETPAVVHVEAQPEVKKEEVAPAPTPAQDKTPTPVVEEKKQDAPLELGCDELRVLACQFLSDPAVQLIFPDLVKAVLGKVVEEARAKADPSEAAKRVLEIVTSNNVIQNHPAMATLAPHLGKVQQVLARVLGCIPTQFVDVLDKVKDGFQPNVESLMALLSNPMDILSGGFDCGKFDLGSLGLPLPSLLGCLSSFPCGPFDFGFECKGPCESSSSSSSSCSASAAPSSPSGSASSHDNVRCDGCGVFPIVGPRYNCTVCRDFDLCANCERTAGHPPEHPLLKYRQPANTPTVHHGITCDGCQMSPITGIRFKCRVCPDYDLCQTCEAKNTHPADHPLIKFKVEKMRQGQGHGGWRGRPHPFHSLHSLAQPLHSLAQPLHALFPEVLRGRPFGLHGLFGEGWRGHHGGHRRWLARGSVGDGVKEIQKALNIEVDGFFGPKTEQAVKEFQAAQSLDVDGIVGPRTRAKLLDATPSEKKRSRARKKRRVLQRRVRWIDWRRGGWLEDPWVMPCERSKGFLGCKLMDSLAPRLSKQ